MQQNRRDRQQIKIYIYKLQQIKTNEIQLKALPICRVIVSLLKTSEIQYNVKINYVNIRTNCSKSKNKKATNFYFK